MTVKRKPKFIVHLPDLNVLTKYESGPDIPGDMRMHVWAGSVHGIIDPEVRAREIHHRGRQVARGALVCVVRAWSGEKP